MAAAPLVIEIWAIVVSTTWQEGGGISYLHDGEKPVLFATKAAAKSRAKECHDDRVEKGFPLAKYKPMLVRIAPAESVRPDTGKTEPPPTFEPG